MIDQNLKDVYSLLSEKFISWYELGIKSIPNILVALLVLITFLFLAKAIKKIARRFIPRVSKNPSVTKLLVSVLHISTFLIGLFVALGILSLDKTVTSLLAGAGVIGLAVGFAFQEIASNFFSGILIAFTEPYKLGDIVEAGGYLGEVTSIDLRTTSITNFQGLEVLVPNKDMFTKPFTNMTTTPKRRIDIEVGVSYGDNLRLAKKIVEQELQNIPERLEGHDVKVFFKEFGASSINFVAHLWINYPGQQSYLNATSEAIMVIQEKFNENGITIPFPIRTLDLPSEVIDFLMKNKDK
jgi:small conductance mechanosensitive channel